MNDLGLHLLLFLVASVVIVLMGAFYSEAADGPAFRAFPRRLLVFLAGCAVLVAVVLVCEHTFAAL